MINALSPSGQYAPVCRPLKKGEDCAPALWLRASVNHSAGVSDFLRRWRRFISPLAAATKKPAVLSPSSLLCSIPSITSWGIRTVVICDFAFFAPVTIPDLLIIWCMSEYTIGRQKKSLEVYFTLVVGLASLVTYTKSSEARKCGNTNRASNHNVTEAYTMAGTQHTQTHPKYQYRFMALLRADMTAAPCRLTIEATSEREARQRLAGRYVLSFAGCIPAQEVRHV